MGTITVTNLGKAYKQYLNRWSRLANRFILAPFGRNTVPAIAAGLENAR